MTKIAEYVVALNNAFDARASFEASKMSDNSNIQKTLSNLRKSVTRESVARVFVAHNIDAALINRALRVDSRINVYAYQKIENIACALNKAESLNHYSKAILATAKRFADNSMSITQDDAKSACTLDMKVKDAKREKLIVKYQKHVAVSTANTQASSSLEALCTFDVLKRAKNNENETVFVLQDNETTKALLTLIA